MELYILRHGTTAWNMQQKIQGQTDIPLDDFGREMALETGKGLKEKGITFDKTYSSPLLRAFETAKLIVGENTEIICDDRLKELSFGFMDGGNVTAMTNDESLPFRFFKTAPEKYEDAVLSLRDGDLPESLSNLCLRAKGFLEEKIEPYAGEDSKVLLSVHGALSKALLMHIRGEKDLAKFWGEGLLPNCGMAIVNVSIKDHRAKYEIKQPSSTFYDESIKERAPKLL